MSTRLPHIALDLGTLDTLRPAEGLYRYVVDLVNALSDLDPPARFIVLGAFPQPAPDLATAFDRKGWHYRHVSRTLGRGAFYRDQLRLATTLARIRPDVCHCLHAVIPIGALCPLVVTVQDMMYELFPEYFPSLQSRSYRAFKWTVRHRARRVICPSRTSADDLARLWGLPSDRIDVVAHGLRAFEGEPAGEPQNDSLRQLASSPFISSPLNLEPRKNLIVLLEAFARLRSRLPDTRLVLYGRAGWAEDRERKYRADLDRLGVRDRVVEPGVVSDSDLWWLYSRSDVFVFPTLYEGFGYPALEAMAAGTCPVVRGCSSMAEVVGPAGIQVEPLTSESLAKAIFDLLANEPLRRALATAARVRAAGFTARRMAEATFATYMRALGRSSSTQ